MGRKVARYEVLALTLGLALVSMRCTVQLVNTQTATVNSDTTGLTTRLDFNSEPTPNRPVASFRAYRTALVKDTRRRETSVRYRPAPLAWASTVVALIAGGVADLWLSGSGRVVLGRDMLAIGVVPLTGAAIGALGTFRRTSILTDTSRFTTPLPVAVKCGGREVATLSPDAFGTAEFKLSDYLSSLPVVNTDTVLSVCVAASGGPSRNFALTESTYASAVAVHRVDIERREREEREQRLAAERAQEEERAEAIAAEIDTVCSVYEGLYSGACLSNVLLFKALGGASTTSDQIECLRQADGYMSQYKHATSMLTEMHYPSHFEKTYSALRSLAADLPRYVQACYELITTGDLYTVTSAEYRRLHARFWGTGESDGLPVVTQFQAPFKQELLKVGLSKELVNDLVLCGSGWAVHNPLQSQPGNARDYYYPRILNELLTESER